MKRAFDASLAAAGLIVSSPLWIVFATAIQFEDGGPVFYRQRRVGIGGRTFEALKFRSMRPDAERATGAIQAGVFGLFAAFQWLRGAPHRAFALDRAVRGLGKVFFGGPFAMKFYGRG